MVWAYPKAGVFYQSQQDSNKDASPEGVPGKLPPLNLGLGFGFAQSEKYLLD